MCPTRPSVPTKNPPSTRVRNWSCREIQLRTYFDFRRSAFVWAACVLALAAITTPNAAFGQSTKTSSGDVWFWFGDCKDGKTMGVELSVEGKTEYRSTFHACRMKRTEANSDREAKTKTTFHFPGGHTFQDTYHTAKQGQIECDIWQAGADPGDILLGVAFATHNEILLNTIHIVRPGKSTQSELDDGVVIKTYPVTSTPLPAADR